MKFYTPFEYMLIDVASCYGLDKLTFDKRIQWTKDNFSQLENYFKGADPTYVKAVMALRSVCKGKPTGHMISLDSTSSGIQLMSAMTGCIKGCEATNLVDPADRKDIYTTATQLMNTILKSNGSSVNVPRDMMKKALMTSYYQSTAMPKNLFGEDTPELKAFYQAAKELAPGAWELLQDCKNSWTPVKKHSWVTADGFHVHIKVMVTKETRIEIDELDHATFTYQYKVNEEQPKGRSTTANMVHSVDGMVVREMHRRVNHDKDKVLALKKELLNPTKKAKEEWIERFEKTNFPSLVVLDELGNYGAIGMSDKHKELLLEVVEDVLMFDAVPLVTIHDCFKTLPSGCNAVRWHYMKLMVSLAKSTVLDDFFSTLLGTSIKYQKLGNVADLIAKSDYAIC